MSSISEILEAADHLSVEDQAMLVELLHKRWIERERQRLAAEIAESEREFAEGRTKVGTPEEIMREILS